jgi:hypothetical protein
MTVTPTDLGTYLGVAVDDARAQLVIDLATQLCQSVVTPLPVGAEAVILDVAVRGYANPTSVPAQAAGPFSVGGASGGVWLTRANKATLRRLAGSGGAFTIDTLPETAGAGLPPWEINTWGYGPGLGTDWDTPA